MPVRVGGVPGVGEDEVEVDRGPGGQPGGRGRHDVGLDVSDVTGDPHPRDGGGTGGVRFDAGSHRVLAETHLGWLNAERAEQLSAGRGREPSGQRGVTLAELQRGWPAARRPSAGTATCSGRPGAAVTSVPAVPKA